MVLAKPLEYMANVQVDVGALIPVILTALYSSSGVILSDLVVCVVNPILHDDQSIAGLSL